MKGKKADIVLMAVILWAGVERAQAACPRPITTTLPFLNLPCPTDDPRWSEAFVHWDRRGEKAEVEAAVKIFEALLQDNPDRLEARLWVMRSYYALGMTKRGEAQIAQMKKTVEMAEKVLALDPKNEIAFYWRWAALVFYYNFTEKDFAEIHAFGARYQHLRELPVPEDDPLWAKAIGHWDARLKREESLAAIELFSRLEKKYPDRIEPKLWLARSHYWMHFLEPGEKEKAHWCFQASEWGKKAIQKEPRNPAANFLTAAALGMYATHTSFVNYVRYAPEITLKLMVVMEEDPNYYYGGVSQYFCSAIARAGELVSKSLELVGYPPKLIEKNTIFASHYEPRYLRNFLALGEMYLAQGKKEEGRKILETVLNSDPSALKNMEPENRIAQDLAREFLAQHFPEEYKK